MMLESGSSDPNVLAFFQKSELHIQDLTKPNLIAIVDDSNLAWVVINLK